MRRSYACLWIALAFAAWTQAHACSCAEQNGCWAARPHDSMFLAKVLRERAVTQPLSGDSSFIVTRHIYTFSVLESLHGEQRRGSEVEVETGTGGGDCGFHFELGERYLVDAYGKDKLSTSICSLTALEAEAGVTLRELRAAIAGKRLPDLSGIVVRRSPDGTRSAETPTGLAGVPVTLTAKDGTQFLAVTEQDGVYTIATMPSGEYTAAFLLPEKLMTSDGNKPRGVTIPETGGVGAACHLSLSVYSAGRIPVHVVDAQGQGIIGFLAAYAAPPSAGAARSWASAGFVGADGKMTLGPLRAGTYRIEFEKESKPPTWYYPGTLRKLQAQGVTVIEGEAAPEITFVITP